MYTRLSETILHTCIVCMCTSYNVIVPSFITHTVRSFVEMTKLLLTENRGLFLLSERFSQDSLENYFGKQRARGGRNENPNLVQTLVSAAALRVQSSAAMDTVRGNCRRKRQLDFSEREAISDTPLPKRKSARRK